jgi:SAM-dependent methyltransferase
VPDDDARDDDARPSTAFYNRLASSLDEFYAAPHRKAYDDLAWERIARLPIERAGVVLDIGCGTARWADRLIDAGWTYVGVDDATEMVVHARRNHPRAEIIAASMDDVELPGCSGDLIIAMGSFQYSRDPAALARRMGEWANPGAYACVLVDSYVGLLLELVRLGRSTEARERMRTRRSRWTMDGDSVSYALFDAAALAATFRQAGFVDVDVAGLLVGMSSLGREKWLEQFAADREATLELERALADDSATADAGKHLLLTARWPRG